MENLEAKANKGNVAPPVLSQGSLEKDVVKNLGAFVLPDSSLRSYGDVTQYRNLAVKKGDYDTIKGVNAVVSVIPSSCECHSICEWSP